MYRLVTFLGLLFLGSSCIDEERSAVNDHYPLRLVDTKRGLDIVVHREEKNDSLCFLFSKIYKEDKLVDSSEWKLHCPVLGMDKGDIDGNGIDELLVITLKTTRYDSVPRPRPFLYKLHKGHILPLWLGSRLSMPLVDARLIGTSKGCRLRSIEKDSSGAFLVVDYRWKGFGVQFDRYLAQGLSETEARTVFENDDL